MDKLYGPNTVNKLGLSRIINSCDLTKPLTLSFGLVSSELFPPPAFNQALATLQSYHTYQGYHSYQGNLYRKTLSCELVLNAAVSSLSLS
jgi:hypothetical protein